MCGYLVLLSFTNLCSNLSGWVECWALFNATFFLTLCQKHFLTIFILFYTPFLYSILVQMLIESHEPLPRPLSWPVFISVLSLSCFYFAFWSLCSSSSNLTSNPLPQVCLLLLLPLALWHNSKHFFFTLPPPFPPAFLPTSNSDLSVNDPSPRQLPPFIQWVAATAAVYWSLEEHCFYQQQNLTLFILH